MSDDTVRPAIEALRGPTHPGDPEAEQVVQELHQLCGQHAQELHVQHPQIPYEQLYDRILLEMMSYLTHAMEDKA